METRVSVHPLRRRARKLQTYWCHPLPLLVTLAQNRTIFSLTSFVLTRSWVRKTIDAWQNFFWWEGLFCVQLARLFLFENKLARLFVFAAYNTNSMTLFDETAYLNCSNSPTATYIYIFCTSTSICYIHVPISMSISTSITISISISTVCLICDPDWQTTLHTNSRPLVQHDS